MRTFIADIIPSIGRFSQRLDDLTKLTNQHWVSLGEINDAKKVYIFRESGQLLISLDGRVERGSWEYLGNQSLLICSSEGDFLLKHGFFDEHVIALKMDSSSRYAFFVNESRNGSELNTLDEITRFLTNRYLKGNRPGAGLGNHARSTITDDSTGYIILNESIAYDLLWGGHTSYQIRFNDGRTGYVFRGDQTGKFFYHDLVNGKVYCNDREDCIDRLYRYLKSSGY